MNLHSSMQENARQVNLMNDIYVTVQINDSRIFRIYPAKGEYRVQEIVRPDNDPKPPVKVCDTIEDAFRMCLKIYEKEGEQ